jgi:hypothetical protein
MHACTKIKVIRRWCRAGLRGRFSAKRRRGNDVGELQHAKFDMEGAAWWEDQGRLLDGSRQGALLIGRKYWYFSQSENPNHLEQAAAGQPSSVDELSNNRGGGCSTSLLLAVWVVSRP